ncbi:MAG: DUF3047 domain-containing protein [Burkholderiales bacterium]|jgi:hypothetical protein
MRSLPALALAIALATGSVNANGPQQVAVAEFSRLQAGDKLPVQWEPITLRNVPKHTQYALVSDHETTVLRAQADASISGLGHAKDVDPLATPWLQWRWRIADVNQKSDLHHKKGDDFPVRLYVFFDYDLNLLPLIERIIVRITRAIYGDRLPLAALCYVWAPHEPIGTSAWNPYTARVRTIVASSGRAQAGTWVTVERNIVDDYRSAFGEPVPRITGVALATDSDNTGAQSLAWYGDIVFTAQPTSTQ